MVILSETCDSLVDLGYFHLIFREIRKENPMEKRILTWKSHGKIVVLPLDPTDRKATKPSAAPCC